MIMNHMIALKSLESIFLKQIFYFYFKYFDVITETLFHKSLKGGRLMILHCKNSFGIKYKFELSVFIKKSLYRRE